MPDERCSDSLERTRHVFSQRPLSTICLAAIVLSVTLSVFLQSSPSRAAIEIETRPSIHQEIKENMLACTGVKERLIQNVGPCSAAPSLKWKQKRGIPKDCKDVWTSAKRHSGVKNSSLANG